MKFKKCEICAILAAGLLLTSCGTSGAYKIHVIGCDGDKVQDDYSPFAGMSERWEITKEGEEKQIRINGVSYTGQYTFTERLRYNNYRLERYQLTGEAKGEFSFKEDTDELQLLWLDDVPILKSDTPPMTEQEVADLTQEVIRICLGEKFRVEEYEMQIKSHLNDLEDAYEFDRNLEGFVSTQENPDIDFYDVTYRKKLGDFDTEDTILIDVYADGAVYQFSSFMLGAYKKWNESKESKEELEDMAVAEAVKRYTGEDGTVPKGYVNTGSLLLDEKGKLVYMADVNILDSNGSHDGEKSVTVYVELPASGNIRTGVILAVIVIVLFGIGFGVVIKKRNKKAY